MGSKYTEEECEAMNRKIEHPEEDVICPRCGNKLLYTSVGASCEVKCETEGCLHGTIRGL